jgi:hypothetical protein
MPGTPPGFPSPSGPVDSDRRVTDGSPNEAGQPGCPASSVSRLLFLNRRRGVCSLGRNRQGCRDARGSSVVKLAIVVGLALLAWLGEGESSSHAGIALLARAIDFPTEPLARRPELGAALAMHFVLSSAVGAPRGCPAPRSSRTRDPEAVQRATCCRSSKFPRESAAPGTSAKATRTAPATRSSRRRC